MRRILRSRPMVAGILVVLLTAGTLGAQTRREIQFPDTLGYKTLKCDLHIHTDECRSADPAKGMFFNCS